MSNQQVRAPRNKIAQSYIFRCTDQNSNFRKTRQMISPTDINKIVHYTLNNESSDLIDGEDNERRVLTNRSNLDQIYSVCPAANSYSKHLVDSPKELQIGNGVATKRILRNENYNESPIKPMKEIRMFTPMTKLSPNNSEISTQAPTTTNVKVSSLMEGRTERKSPSKFIFTNSFHLSPLNVQQKQDASSSIQQLVTSIELMPKLVPLSAVKTKETESMSETNMFEPHRYASPSKKTEQLSSTHRNRGSPQSTLETRRKEDPYQKLKQEFIEQIANYQKKPTQNSTHQTARRLTPSFKETGCECLPTNQKETELNVTRESPEQSALFVPHNSELDISFKKDLACQLNANNNDDNINKSREFTSRFPDFNSNFVTKFELEMEDPRNSAPRYIYDTREIILTSQTVTRNETSFDYAMLTTPQADEEGRNTVFCAEKSLLDFSWGNDSRHLRKIRQANGLSIDESSIQAAEPSFSYYSTAQKQNQTNYIESPIRSYALQLSLAIDPIEEEGAYEGESEGSLLRVNDRYLYNDLRWKNEKIELAEELEEGGLNYFEKKDFPKAIQALSKSLVIKQNHLGRENLNIATLLYKIGFVFTLKGDYTDALKCYMESLEIFQKHTASEPCVAEILQNIGNVYFKLQFPLKAKQFYSKSLELKLKRFGEIHREVAKSMVNIANILKIEGKIQDAAVIYQRGTEILLKNSNNDEELAHASVAMNNLGLTLIDLNRCDEALSVFEKCLGIKKQLFGENSYQVQEVLGNIGNALFKLGDVKRALNNYQKALAIKSNLGRSSHTFVEHNLITMKK